MAKTFKLSAVVALICTTILVMAGCTSDTPPATTEKVVDISSLPALYKPGEKVEVMTCGPASYRWMGCDSVFHPGMKLVLDSVLRVTTQGEKVNIAEDLGVTANKELILRDKTPLPVVKKDAPVAPAVRSHQSVSKAKSGPHWWNTLPWGFFGYILFAGITIAAIMLLAGLIRRLAHWMMSPIMSRTNTTHVTTSNESGGSSSPAPSGNTGGGGTSDTNPRGAVVVNRAGDMVERTTTVTERFVIRDGHRGRGQQHN